MCLVIETWQAPNHPLINNLRLTKNDLKQESNNRGMRRNSPCGDFFDKNLFLVKKGTASLFKLIRRGAVM